MKNLDDLLYSPVELHDTIIATQKALDVASYEDLLTDDMEASIDNLLVLLRNHENQNLKTLRPELEADEQREFERQAFAYGFTGDDYRKSFTSKGETFFIVGFKSSSPKFPIIAVNTAGKRYKFAENSVYDLK